MNKDLYRLIYNRALRLWQVASERATAPGGTPGPSTTAQRPARACLHPIPFALWLSLGWVSIAGIATAQVIADPHAPGHQRPTVLATPNGTPLIHIQTPSQAGVSRNTYQQFDITPQGAILNNARTPAQTHLAGTVQGNPWLATGTAKIILNEVNSRTPSQLHGYLEVAGDRAQLIIANPSGITCNGCGVINASQFTLTTGTPVFNARGALDHYRVHGGAIQLDGLGLDSRSADYTALIARTVQLNAGLWAQKLQATTGPATVTLDGHPTASLPTAPGDRPTVALDVSALGGMYAGKITLIGTEHGLGVRNAGQLSATSAPLTVTVDGLLENTGRLQSATDTQLTATAAVNNSGLISVAQTLSLHTPTTIDNRSGTLTAARLDITGARLDNRGGHIQQTGLQPLTLQTQHLDNQAQGRLGALETPASGQASPADPTPVASVPPATDTPASTGTMPIPSHPQTAPVLAAGRLTLENDIDNRGGHITAGGAIDAILTDLDNRDGTAALNRLTLQGQRLDNQHGILTLATEATIHTHTLNNAAGQLHVNGALDLTAQHLNNASGHLLTTGPQTATLTIADLLDNTSGTLASAGSLTLTAATLDTTEGTVQSGQGPLHMDAAILTAHRATLTSQDTLTLTGTHIDLSHATTTAQHITLHTDTLTTAGGHLTAYGTHTLQLEARTRLDNTGGTIATNGTLDLHTAALDNTGGTVHSTATGPNRLDITDTFTNTAGHLLLNGPTTLTTGTWTNTGGHLQITGPATLHATTLDNRGGVLHTATGPLDLRITGTLNNQDNGLLTTTDALTLTLQDSLDTAGTLSATGLLTLTTAGDLTNRGLLQAADLTAHARDITTTATGQLLTTGHTHLTATGTLSNSGHLQAADLTAQARDITTTATGQLLATGHAHLTATGTLTNRGHLQAADLTAQANTITTTGTFLATSHATLTAADTLTNSGLLQAPDLTAQANTITNTATGQLLTTGHAQLTATDTLTNSGLVHAGDLTVHARDITNTATGQLIANTLAQLTATATLTNRGLIDAFTTHLSAPTIDNLGTGRLYGDHIALHAQTLTNRDETSDGHTHAATIAARQRLDIGADTLRNTANAMILSDGDAAIGATLDNALHATGTATLLDNRSATIDITGTLNITTTTLNNIRDNVHIAHAPDVVTEARMEQPHWRKNQPNGGSGNFRFTSNYDAHDIYYLNPADIIKDDPYITPDGQQIHRAIVRLTPQTSAYFYARGGLYASQAERRRMDLTARTGDSVVLYYTDRQDKQPNPDHVAAAATNHSAFIGLDTPQQNERFQTVPITYAPGDDRLTYDSNYGTCTDDCVRLVTWHDYTDPDHTLIDMHRGPNDVRDNEKYRDATRTTQEEILNLDAGAPALIQSGGTMLIQTDTLRNHYADLLAGGDQTIVGLPPHPTKEKSDDDSGDEQKYNRALLIDNRALQLSRTDTFQNTSTTYRGDTHTWTNESRTTPTKQIGGRITSGRHQHIAAQTLNNVTDSTHAPEPIQHVTYNPSTQTLSVVNGVITITDTSPSLHTLSLADNHRSADQELTYIPDRSITTPNAPIRDPAAPPPSPSPPPAPSPCPTTASSPFTPTPPPSSPPTPALPSAATSPAPPPNSTPWATTTPSTNASATATTNNASSANKSPNSPAAAASTATPTTTSNTAPSWMPASPSPNSTNCAPALPSVPTNSPNSPAISSGSSNKTSTCPTAPPPAPSSPASTCAPAPATSPQTAPSWRPPAPPSTPTPSPTPAPLTPATSSTSTPTPWTNKAAASPPTPSTSTPPATSPPSADNSKPVTSSKSKPKATSLLAAPCVTPPPKAAATTA
ncbi:filamentous hemagglutinin N-terminal domain-containing protein [Xylella fastidiosa subsp. pauca]|nr:filamentous hemagglutinin N-terminal domain-containing protein [Xylella fastidiosa]WGZ31732.1 filamentous hemagglutinin N-terminal domain-containing protein [Xylella fastidiosa subsp. pauca]